MIIQTENFKFYKLDWDTHYFGVSCAKAILLDAISKEEWSTFKKQFPNYQFISIENRNSNITNSQLIGRETKAFLADVNVQFTKHTTFKSIPLDNIEIRDNLDYNTEVVNLTSFKFSKFIEDPEFAKRNGHEVYTQWITNSFNKDDKYFALYKNSNKSIDGFILYSFQSSGCVIELISVSGTASNKGIGTLLLNAVTNNAFLKNCHRINVGTQLKNLQAINFYHKNGFKQHECHQVYHLWMPK